MPMITCPTCGSMLEVDASDIGRTVECGSCMSHFEAKAPRPPRPINDEPPRRRPDSDRIDRPFRESHEEDYYRTTGLQPGTGMGQAAMILGIIGVVLCFCGLGLICNILAIIFGILAQKTEGHAQGKTGLILGIVGLLLYALLIVGYIVLIVAGGIK